jgi:sugar/nucleoside kinase (ribokinase family)
LRTSMYDFITIGGATRDTFFEISDGHVVDDIDGSGHLGLLGFEYGAKIIPDQAFFSYGGGAVNTSINLSKMGFSVAGCSRVGSEGTGDILLNDIKEHGVDWRFVERDPELHTALSFIIEVPGADRVIFQYPGANSNLALANLEEIETKWVYLTSLTGQSIALLPRIAAIAKTGKTRLIFNPGETQLRLGYGALKDIIGASYVLMVNREEAEHLIQTEAHHGPPPSIKDLFKAACGWGPRYVVITDGLGGSFVSDGSQTYYLPSYPAKTLDMTGAGDAYGAGFVGGLIRYDSDIGRAMKLAAANAASVVSQRGAHRGSLSFNGAEAVIGRYPDIAVETMEMT